MKDKALIGASLIAGIAASLCCILPIVFALAGVGIVGASAFFAAWRPFLLAVTFFFLLAGLYFAYRKPKQSCAPGSVCEKPITRRTGRIGLWLAIAIVLVIAAFPYYSETVANFVLFGKGQSADASSHLDRASFVVDGMDCNACATAIEKKLIHLNGVQNATVSYDQKQAIVEFDRQKITIVLLEKAIRDAGYRVHRP